MIGNVWEWTTDWYARKHEADAPKPCCIPRTRAAGARRELRPVPAARSESRARSSKAARTLRAELLPPLPPGRAPRRSRSTRRRAISDSAASFEKRVSNGRKLRSHIERLLRLADVRRSRRDRGGAGSRRPIPSRRSNDIRRASARRASASGSSSRRCRGALQPCTATDVCRPSALAMVHGTGDRAVADCGRRDCRQRLE